MRILPLALAALGALATWPVPATAQPSPAQAARPGLPHRDLRTPAAVAAVVASARSKIVVLAPTVRSGDVAAALSQAARRGVQVFLVLDERAAVSRGSYALTLAATRNVYARTVPGMAAYVGIVDDHTVIASRLLEGGRLAAGETSMAFNSPQIAAIQSQSLPAVWAKGKPLKGAR